MKLGERMKVISLIQPWATLIALGEKTIETRSWKTSFRGVLGIHASKTIDKKACEIEPVKSILAKHGYTATNLPTGAILATTKLVGCYRMIDDSGQEAKLANDQIVTGKEYLFGDYTPGRWAWDLRNVERFPNPIPAKGKLRIWEYENEEVETIVLRR